MGILIVPDGSGDAGVGQARTFEAFARDVALKHGHVGELSPIPIGDQVWGYHVTGDTPLMMRCHATADPIDRHAVSAFYGEVALAPDDRTVALLLSTGGFTADRSNSARAFAEDIHRRGVADFHLYDADEMVEIVSSHRKLTPPRELLARVEQATGAMPAAHDLVLSSSGRYWLVELGSSDPGCYLILEPGGELAPAELIARRFSELVKVRPQLLSADRIVNQRYAATLRGRPSAPVRQAGTSAGSLIALVESDRRLRQQTDVLARNARGHLCHERGDSVCHEYERAMITFLDHILPIEFLREAYPAEKLGDDRQAAAALLTAARIAALYLASQWAHRADRKGLGTPRTVAQVLLKAANFTAPWFELVPQLAETSVAAILALAVDCSRLEHPTLDPIVGLAGHLAGAFGPFCASYRETLHQQLLPDEEPSLGEIPRMETLWTDEATQKLKILVAVPTPRGHRHVMSNRALLQLALESVEDVLGRAGEMLPFTRIQVSTSNASFEQIECYFELESEHILKIFMGEELYSSKDVWIRELLQNAIDATHLRQVLLDEEDYRPEIAVVHDAKRGEIQVADNGIGMSLYHVRKFFSKVGRSYYRSTELEDELRRKNRNFNPISRFGVGFLSVFMTARSAEILTAHVDRDGPHEGLSIFIPALMEDFFVRRNEPRSPGTKITLELEGELSEPVADLVRKYILRPTVDMRILLGDEQMFLPATEQLSITPNIVDDAKWSPTFRMISAQVKGDGYSALIGVLIPRYGAGMEARKYQELWAEMPKTRLALAQAGIWVKDDNEFFGERRGMGEAYHPYFKRLYGIVDFQPGTLKMNVSRNDFVLDKAASATMKRELLTTMINALVEAIHAEATQFKKPKEGNDYLRAVLFGTIEDGEEYYWSRNRSAAQLRYSNSEALTAAMADVLAKHFTLDQRTLEQPAEHTVDQIMNVWKPGQDLYYTLVPDLDHDPLFKAWLTDQPVGTRVFLTKTRREASLLIKAFQLKGYTSELREVSRKQLQLAIRFTVLVGELDAYLLACAGIVEFGQYKPTTATLVLPTANGRSVSRAIGLVSMRADCTELPFVLLDAGHWLTQFLTAAAKLAREHDEIGAHLREICQLLVLNIALGDTVGIRREGLQALNNRLTRLYACIEKTGKAADLPAIRRREMATMSELVGERR